MSQELPGESPAEKLDPVMNGFDLTKAGAAFTNAIEATVEQQKKRAEYRAALISKLNVIRWQNLQARRAYWAKRIGLGSLGIGAIWLIRRYFR